MVIYVDDILISGSNEAAISEVKGYLHLLFTINNMRQASYLLAVELKHTDAGISLSQTKYATDILSDVGMTDSVASSSPLS